MLVILKIRSFFLVHWHVQMPREHRQLHPGENHDATVDYRRQPFHHWWLMPYEFGTICSENMGDRGGGAFAGPFPGGAPARQKRPGEQRAALRRQSCRSTARQSRLTQPQARCARRISASTSTRAPTAGLRAPSAGTAPRSSRE